MKILREIAGRIFATWAVLAFIATLLVIFIPFLIFSYAVREPKKTRRRRAR